MRARRVAAAPGRGAGDVERVGLPAADADVLRDLLLAEDARVVVEIGLAYGSSALAIGEALVDREGARHVVIDAYQDHFANIGWDRVLDAGLDAICELRVERSQLALPHLVAEGLRADAAFVDGSHLFHNVVVDLTHLREIVRPGGLIVLDDCEWPSVAAAVQYFERNTGWTPVEVPGRLRAMRLPDPPVEPRFEDFRPFPP